MKQASNKLFLKTKKLSTLLFLSMRDVEVIEKTPGYTFNMLNWVSKGQSTCYVCQAGASMVRRFGVQGTMDPFDLHHVPLNIRSKLYALNALRIGAVRLACMRLDISWTDKLEFIFPIGVTAYNTHGYSYIPKYKSAMKRLIKDLKKAGI